MMEMIVGKEVLRHGDGEARKVTWLKEDGSVAMEVVMPVAMMKQWGIPVPGEENEIRR